MSDAYVGTTKMNLFEISGINKLCRHLLLFFNLSDLIITITVRLKLFHTDDETGKRTVDHTFSHTSHVCLFVCVEVLRPSQPNGVMSSAG